MWPASFRSQDPTGPCRSSRRTCRVQAQCPGSLEMAAVQVPFPPLPESVCSNKQPDERARGHYSGQPPAHLCASTCWEDEKMMGTSLCTPLGFSILVLNTPQPHPAEGKRESRSSREPRRERGGHAAVCRAQHEAAALLQKTEILDLDFYRLATSSAGCSPNFSPRGDFQPRPKSSLASLNVSVL